MSHHISLTLYHDVCAHVASFNSWVGRWLSTVRKPGVAGSPSFSVVFYPQGFNTRLSHKMTVAF